MYGFQRALIEKSRRTHFFNEHIRRRAIRLNQDLRHAEALDRSAQFAWIGRRHCRHRLTMWVAQRIAGDRRRAATGTRHQPKRKSSNDQETRGTRAIRWASRDGPSLLLDLLNGGSPAWHRRCINQGHGRRKAHLELQAAVLPKLCGAWDPSSQGSAAQPTRLFCARSWRRTAKILRSLPATRFANVDR